MSPRALETTIHTKMSASLAARNAPFPAKINLPQGASAIVLRHKAWLHLAARGVYSALPGPAIQMHILLGALIGFVATPRRTEVHIRNRARETNLLRRTRSWKSKKPSGRLLRRMSCA